MNILWCFSCLVALAVTAEVAGAPEQQLAIEDQIAEFGKDHLERQVSSCKTKSLCKDYGGECIPNAEVCIGDRYKGRKFCKGKGCKCCIPLDPNLVDDAKCSKTQLGKVVAKCFTSTAIPCILADAETCWTLIKTCVDDECFPSE